MDKQNFTNRIRGFILGFTKKDKTNNQSLFVLGGLK